MSLISLTGFADIDVPVIDEDIEVISSEDEIEVMVVNPCTGLIVPDFSKGNMIDAGGTIYGQCDDLNDSFSMCSISDNSMLDSTEMFDTSSTDIFESDISSSFDDSFSSFDESFNSFDDGLL